MKIALACPTSGGCTVCPSTTFSFLSSCFVPPLTHSPCQAEIADLEHAVRVDKEVSGLDITVDDLGRVEVLDAAQDLVEKDLDVVCGKVLRGHDNLVQIRLHQLGDHVNLLEEVDVRWLGRGEKKQPRLLSLQRLYCKLIHMYVQYLLHLNLLYCSSITNHNQSFTFAHR